MTTHSTALQQQHQRYADIRKRLMGAPAKTEKVKDSPAPETVIKIVSSDDKSINSLRNVIHQQTREIKFLKRCLKDQTAADIRIQQLELDLADARARILAQAEKLMIEDEEIGGVEDKRRPVRVIVDEVLQDFPGITFDDVKGLRRTKTLITPRHACIRAVFNERKDLSSVAIGRIFGNRDHSTILASVAKTAGDE
jgi:chromosomal replication initiation ATPase DnaA